VARSDNKVRTPAVGGARGEAVGGGGMVGRRAVVGMDTRGPDSAFKVWSGTAHGSHTATAR
jgi:hypothetical protein